MIIKYKVFILDIIPNILVIYVIMFGKIDKTNSIKQTIIQRDAISFEIFDFFNVLKTIIKKMTDAIINAILNLIDMVYSLSYTINIILIIILTIYLILDHNPLYKLIPLSLSFISTCISLTFAPFFIT